MLHVTGLGGPATVEAGAVALFRIEFDPIGWIGNQQEGLAVAQEADHGVRTGGVPAEDPVLIATIAAQPLVPQPGRWIFRQGRRDIGLFVVVGERQEICELSGVKTCQRQVEVGRGQFLQLQGEQFIIPISPRYRSIHTKRKAFTCASVHSSQRITGIPVVSPPGHDPNFRAALILRWPSTTVPSLSASTGTLNPNSRMLLHMRSTTASFLRGLRA
jgi:hypothetical protein